MEHVVDHDDTQHDSQMLSQDLSRFESSQAMSQDEEEDESDTSEMDVDQPHRRNSGNQGEKLSNFPLSFWNIDLNGDDLI